VINKILVPTDGSEPSAEALDYAVDLADKYSAEILLLSVVPPVTIPTFSHPAAGITPGLPAPITLGAYSKELSKGHKEVLSNALRWVKKHKPELKVSTKLEEGRPSDRIVQNVQEEGCEIIVMGSRGLGRMKGLLLGSVSDKVADDAPCPVLIVK
jgi:nucleotide-binding universal stress UspA family protein